jgi:hypothetical protein
VKFVLTTDSQAAPSAGFETKSCAQAILSPRGYLRDLRPRRYIIVRFDNEAALEKFDRESKAWIEKNAPHSRSVKVEGIEQK